MAEKYLTREEQDVLDDIKKSTDAQKKHDEAVFSDDPDINKIVLATRTAVGTVDEDFDVLVESHKAEMVAGATHSAIRRVLDQEGIHKKGYMERSLTEDKQSLVFSGDRTVMIDFSKDAWSSGTLDAIKAELEENPNNSDTKEKYGITAKNTSTGTLITAVYTLFNNQIKAIIALRQSQLTYKFLQDSNVVKEDDRETAEYYLIQSHLICNSIDIKKVMETLSQEVKLQKEKDKLKKEKTILEATIKKRDNILKKYTNDNTLISEYNAIMGSSSANINISLIDKDIETLTKEAERKKKSREADETEKKQETTIDIREVEAKIKALQGAERDLLDERKSIYSQLRNISNPAIIEPLERRLKTIKTELKGIRTKLEQLMSDKAKAERDGISGLPKEIRELEEKVEKLQDLRKKVIEEVSSQRELDAHNARAAEAGTRLGETDTRLLEIDQKLESPTHKYSEVSAREFLLKVKEEQYLRLKYPKKEAARLAELDVNLLMADYKSLEKSLDNQERLSGKKITKKGILKLSLAALASCCVGLGGYPGLGITAGLGIAGTVGYMFLPKRIKEKIKKFWNRNKKFVPKTISDLSYAAVPAVLGDLSSLGVGILGTTGLGAGVLDTKIFKGGFRHVLRGLIGGVGIASTGGGILLAGTAIAGLSWKGSEAGQLIGKLTKQKWLEDFFKEKVAKKKERLQKEGISIIPSSLMSLSLRFGANRETISKLDMEKTPENDPNVKIFAKEIFDRNENSLVPFIGQLQMLVQYNEQLKKKEKILSDEEKKYVLSLIVYLSKLEADGGLQSEPEEKEEKEPEPEENTADEPEETTNGSEETGSSST